MADEEPVHPPGLGDAPEPTGGRPVASFWLPLGVAVLLVTVGYAISEVAGAMTLGIVGVLASLALHAWLGPRDQEAWLRGGFLGFLVGLLVGVPVGVAMDFMANFCIFCDPAPYDYSGYYWGAGIFLASVLAHLGVVWLKAQKAPARPV